MNTIQPDFYVWLGDNPGHDVWDQNKSHHLDSTKHISRRLQRGPYGRPGAVYPVLGNHEGLPCDSFNLEGDSHGWIIQESAEAWKPWLTAAGSGWELWTSA